MDTVTVLMNTGEIATIAGPTKVQQEKLLEATVLHHGVTIIVVTTVLTLMEIGVAGIQPGMIMEFTLKTTVGEMSQVHTALLVLVAQIQQANGLKIVSKLEMIMIPQK
jgi:hypothetical protein